MNIQLTNNEIYTLIILVISILIKVIFSDVIYYGKYLNKFGLENELFDFVESNKILYSGFIDLFSMIIGIYFIFIKQTTDVIFIIIFSALIIKAIFHFLVIYKLYNFFNLSIENEQKLIKFREIETPITNHLLMFLALYILINIFFK